jgi:hypothetical protein
MLHKAETIAIALATIVLLTGCGGNCSPRSARAAYQDLNDVFYRFSTTFSEMTPADRADFQNRLQDLQTIQQRAAALKLPSCASSAQSDLLNYMSATVDAYRAMAEGDQAAQETAFNSAARYFEQFGNELSTLSTQFQ